MEGEVGAKSDWGSGEEGQGRGIHHWICPNDFWIYGLKLSLCKRTWDKVQFWCSGLQHVLTGKGRERRRGEGEHKDKGWWSEFLFRSRILLRLIWGSDIARQKEVRRNRSDNPADCLLDLSVCLRRSRNDKRFGGDWCIIPLIAFCCQPSGYHSLTMIL